MRIYDVLFASKLNGKSEVKKGMSYYDVMLAKSLGGGGEKVSVADGIKAEFLKHFGIELSDENAAFVADYWKDYPTYKFYCYKNKGNGYQYVYISNFIDEEQFLSGSVYVNGSGNQVFYRTVYKASKSKFDNWSEALQYAGQLSNYQDQFVLPDYKKYEKSLN